MIRKGKDKCTYEPQVASVESRSRSPRRKLQDFQLDASEEDKERAKEIGNLPRHKVVAKAEGNRTTRSGAPNPKRKGKERAKARPKVKARAKEPQKASPLPKVDPKGKEAK